MSRMKREFIIDGKTVNDSWPALSPDEAKKFLSEDYPDVLNSSYTENIKDNKLIITFGKATVGTRG